MKRIVILILFLFFVKGQAQNAPYDSLISEVRNFYDNLDPSGMKTNLLFNRGLVILNNLEEWKDGYPVITNLERWKAIYTLLPDADLTGQTQFPPVDSLLKENELNYYGPSTIALAVLNYEGDYLTADTIQQIIQNNIPPGYIQFKLFAGTVLHHKVYDKTVYFKWVPQNYFTNINEPFTLQIDFDDGFGYRTINVKSSQTIPVVYNSVGEKTIRFKYISGSDTLTSYSYLRVVTLEAEVPTEVGEIVVVDTVDTSSSGSNLKTSGDPKIKLTKATYEYYEGYDNKLDKPVIIAEGFDILGTESAKDLYEKWKKRIDSLRNHGYDVFTLNFRAPGRDIQKNAKIVQKLIKGINAKKIGNYEGIYIGESMGGVIGRIALKKLENAGYDHQIGLFVAYDSPMRGANIPKGLQWAFHDAFWGLGPVIVALTYIVELFEFISGADVPVVDLYQQLTSVAAKQLIIRHYKGDGFYNTFQNFLNKFGYPAECRNVAFVNGSDDGTLQDKVNLGDVIFDKTFVFGIYNVGMKAWYSKINVMHQKVSRVTYVSFLMPGINYIVRHEDFDNKPLDNAPGSHVSGRIGIIHKDTVKFCFVPTVSAIDIDTSIFNSGNLAYFNKNETYLINNNLTPFDDIYADDYNNSHIGKEWFYKNFEVQEIMYDHLFLQNRTITKNRDFEAQYTITVGRDIQPDSFSNHFLNPTLNKQIPVGDFVVEPGVNVTLIAEESVTLRPGTHLKSGSNVLIKTEPNPTLHRLAPTPPEPPRIIGSKYICGESVYKATTPVRNPIFKWQLVGEGVNISKVGETFTAPSKLKGGQYTLYCTYTSNKGNSTSSKVLIVDSGETCKLVKQIENSINVGSPKIENKTCIYPNPTTGEVNIKLGSIGIKKHKTLKIKDISGREVMEPIKTTNSQFTFDISMLPDGVYFLEIDIEGKVNIYKVFKY